MIIYISLLTIISLVVVNTVVSLSTSYRNLTALRAVEHSGIDAMERMSRDIRSATSIDLTHSTFGSSPSTLTLVQTSTTTKFYVQSGVMKVDVNGTYSGPLTITNSSVTSFILTHLTSSNSDAVKIDLTISGTSGTVTRTKNFHSTIVLRGS